VGCPLGLDGTVTSGIISALHRPVSTVDAANHAAALDTIQTDVPINAANSGGALVDMKGRLIGMTSAISTLSDSPYGQSGSIGVSFAIPVDQGQARRRRAHRHRYSLECVTGVQAGDDVNTPSARIVEVTQRRSRRRRRPARRRLLSIPLEARSAWAWRDRLD